MYWIKIFISGLLLSFAWPVRGQFGHEWGAMIPGALAAWVACGLMQSESWRKSFAQAVIFSSLGFAVGGDFGYGALVDSIVAASSLQTVIPKLMEVFLIGAVWGGLGMAFLAFALSDLENLPRDLAVMIGSVGTVYVALAGFHVAGGAELYGYTAAFLALHIYNGLLKKSKIIFLFSGYGFAGFGLGFLISVLILWFGTHLAWPGTWWSLRDQIWGFVGGVSVMLACLQANQKGCVPLPLQGPGWQRAGFIFFVTGVTGYNTWNVYTKWFQSVPIVSDPQLWGVFLIVCALLLVSLSLYFLFCGQDIFEEKLNVTLLWTVLFFCWYLTGLAILKSIVYSGWSVWETAFTLFIAESAIFSLVLPGILLTKKGAPPKAGPLLY